MALDLATFKAGLVADLTAIFGDLTGKTAAQKADNIATVICDRVDAFVKTGTVTTTIGLAAAGLQTSTAAGNPTAAPAAPVSITGAIS